MKPGQPLPPPALPSAGLAGAVLTWPLRSRWPSRAGRPRSPEARRRPVHGALVASCPAFWKRGPTTARPSPSHPFGSSLSFQKRPRRPGELDEERGIRWHRLALGRCAPGPSAPARGQLRRASHAASGQRPRHLPAGLRSRLRTATPRPGLPARSSPFSSRPFSLSPPSLLSRRLLLLLPVPSFIS